MSHAPVATRHTVPGAAKTFVGQAAETPSQNSAGSHEPAEARHIATISHLQALLVVLMVLAAAAMARGYGA